MVVKIGNLRNGMKLVVDEVQNFNSVAISFWINVGSRFENSDNQGISHFLEHMMFKGTKTRTALDIALAFDDIGGNFNARTGRESIVLYAKVLKKHLEIAVEIISDIVMNSCFPADEIERERGVIIQEMHEVNDDPSDIIFDKFFETAYKDQSFGSAILGKPETINAFNADDFHKYLSDHCVAEKCVISIAGNVLYDDVLLMMERFFGELKIGKLRDPEPAIYNGGIFVDHRSIGQLNILFGFPLFSYLDERVYTLGVLDGILGTGMSSRLFQEVREKRGLAYSIYSSHSCYSDCGIFYISASTEPKNVRELITVVGGESVRLLSDLNQREFDRVIDRICAEIEMSREGVVSMSDAAGSCLSCYGRYITKEEMYEKTRSVTLDSVIDLWREILSGDMTVAAVGDSSTMLEQCEITKYFSI